MLKHAHSRGALAALRAFKLAGPMGANAGVQPRGDEQSHGTERVQYAKRTNGQPTPDESSTTAGSMPDWLWNLFNYDTQAPGRADGSYGQEVIG